MKKSTLLTTVITGMAAIGVGAWVGAQDEPAEPVAVEAAAPETAAPEPAPETAAPEPAAAEEAGADAGYADEMPGVQQAVRSEDNLISITVDNVALEDVVRMFTKLSDANIVATATNLEGTVTVSLTDVEWRPALSAILEIHQLALVEKTPGSGIWSIVPRSPDEGPPLHVQVIRLRFAKVSDVAPILTAMFGDTGGSVSEFASRNTVIVRATAEALEDINKLVLEIDVPRDQVYIEAKFVELDHGASQQIGVDWQMLRAYTIGAALGYEYSDTRGTVQADDSVLEIANRRSTIDELNKLFDINDLQFEEDTVEFIESPPASGLFIESRTRTPTRTITDTIDSSENVTRTLSESITRTIADVRTAVLSPGDLRVVLSALKEMRGVSIISNPKIIVANEEPALIHIGEREPNIRGTVTPGQQGQANTTTFTLDPDMPYFNFGIELDVIPTVNTASNITVQITPKLTRFVRDKIAPDGNTFPVTSEKSIRTLFSLGNGKTAAIAGLTETAERDVERKIPLLGDLPLIGRYLFRHSDKEESQQETIIFVTVGLANPDMITKNIGLPEYTRRTQQAILRQTVRQRKANEELERLKAATEDPGAVDEIRSMLR